MTMLIFGAISKEFTAELDIKTTEQRFSLDTSSSYNTMEWKCMRQETSLMSYLTNYCRWIFATSAQCPWKLDLQHKFTIFILVNNQLDAQNFVLL